MKFSEVAKRLNGISTPFFGVSWNPGQADVAVARRVIRFLEDRRVMFDPAQVEDPDHCVRSVIEVRHFLTAELGNLAGDHPVVGHLQAMRAACRRFVDAVQEAGGEEFEFLRGSWGTRGTPAWLFNTALGELRYAVGLHVAQLAVKYGVDVEDDLASILPAVEGGEDPDDKPRRRFR
ncbi:MAG: DUF6650 family protein [Actinomycetota bacterium]